MSGYLFLKINNISIFNLPQLTQQCKYTKYQAVPTCVFEQLSLLNGDHNNYLFIQNHRLGYFFELVIFKIKSSNIYFHLSNQSYLGIFAVFSLKDVNMFTNLIADGYGNKS